MLSELMDIRSIAGEKFMHPDQVVFHYGKFKSRGLTCRNPLHRYARETSQAGRSAICAVNRAHF
jgi:hypothetical protein